MPPKGRGRAVATGRGGRGGRGGSAGRGGRGGARPTLAKPKLGVQKTQRRPNAPQQQQRVAQKPAANAGGGRHTMMLMQSTGKARPPLPALPACLALLGRRVGSGGAHTQSRSLHPLPAPCRAPHPPTQPPSGYALLGRPREPHLRAQRLHKHLREAIEGAEPCTQDAHLLCRRPARVHRRADRSLHPRAGPADQAVRAAR